MDESAVTVREARAHLADFNALEDAVDELLAREAEAVLAAGGPTVTMAGLLADLFTERDAGRDSGVM
ncbi:hypothetical protein [Streptomyces sp. NPDC002156]